MSTIYASHPLISVARDGESSARSFAKEAMRVTFTCNSSRFALKKVGITTIRN